jgi:hypothetical protein
MLLLDLRDAHPADSMGLKSRCKEIRNPPDRGVRSPTHLLGRAADSGGIP